MKNGSSSLACLAVLNCKNSADLSRTDVQKPVILKNFDV